MQRISSAIGLASALDDMGPYSWPGGYPIYFVMGDGEAMSFDAVKSNRERCMEGMRDGEPEWTVVGFAINWEDAELYCCHTGERIESAYAEEVADEA